MSLPDYGTKNARELVFKGMINSFVKIGVH
jgi:hypothetical protein